MTGVRWRKMTHFSRQALSWHRIKGHPLTSWSRCFDKACSRHNHAHVTHACVQKHTLGARSSTDSSRQISLVPSPDALSLILTRPSLSLCFSPPPSPGSVLRYPAAGPVHQGGPRKRVPQGGAERAPGQRREGHRHQETRRQGGVKAAWTEEVFQNETFVKTLKNSPFLTNQSYASHRCLNSFISFFCFLSRPHLSFLA